MLQRNVARCAAIPAQCAPSVWTSCFPGEGQTDQHELLHLEDSPKFFCTVSITSPSTWSARFFEGVTKKMPCKETKPTKPKQRNTGDTCTSQNEVCNNAEVLGKSNEKIFDCGRPRLHCFWCSWKAKNSAYCPTVNAHTELRNRILPDKARQARLRCLIKWVWEVTISWKWELTGLFEMRFRNWKLDNYFPAEFSDNAWRTMVPATFSWTRKTFAPISRQPLPDTCNLQRSITCSRFPCLFQLPPNQIEENLRKDWMLEMILADTDHYPSWYVGQVTSATERRGFRTWSGIDHSSDHQGSQLPGGGMLLLPRLQKNAHFSPEQRDFYPIFHFISVAWRTKCCGFRDWPSSASSWDERLEAGTPLEFLCFTGTAGPVMMNYDSHRDCCCDYTNLHISRGPKSPSAPCVSANKHALPSRVGFRQGCAGNVWISMDRVSSGRRGQKSRKK